MRGIYLLFTALTTPLTALSCPSCTSKLGVRVSKAHQTNEEKLPPQRDGRIVRDQLTRAFPLPTSGRFEDLLSAIDDQAKLRRSA
jgi:hypothetical protein